MDPSLLNLTQYYDAISTKIFKIDLNAHKPPFMPFTFADWRAEAYETLKSSFEKMDLAKCQDAKRQFMNRIDNELLNSFIKKMKQPYFDLIFFDSYAVPKGIDLQEARKDYSLFKDLEQLCSQIAEWCIQIEISADLVERAELYGYYSCEKSEQQIYKDLKDQLQGKANKTFGDRIKGLMKSTLAYSLKSLSSIIWTKGISLSNISVGALILLYYSFIGTTSLPIQLLMPNIRISWLMGGIFGSLALNKVAQSIERGQIATTLQKANEAYQKININLQDFNTSCEHAIKDCSLAKTPEELAQQCSKLRKMIRDILDNAENLVKMPEKIEEMRDVVELEDESDDELVIIQLEGEAKDKQAQQQQQQQQPQPLQEQQYPQ